MPKMLRTSWVNSCCFVGDEAELAEERRLPLLFCKGDLFEILEAEDLRRDGAGLCCTSSIGKVRDFL